MSWQIASDHFDTDTYAFKHFVMSMIPGNMTELKTPTQLQVQIGSETHSLLVGFFDDLNSDVYH